MTTKIRVEGPIVNDGDKVVYDWYKMPATSPKSVADMLPEDNSDIDVEINSTGGLIDAGSSIYTALKAYKGKVTVKIVGMAASAASVIAMAGDKVLMSPTAQMMIHNVSNDTYGDYQEHASDAEILKSMTDGLATAYIDKTGKSAEEIHKMMDDVTYMNAQQALDNGFIDEIMFSDDNQSLPLTASVGGMLSQSTLEKLRADSNLENKIDALTSTVNELTKKLNNNEERTAENVNNSKPFVF